MNYSLDTLESNNEDVASKQLNVLKEQMSECGACDLCHGRTQVVFGHGSNNPTIMIVGEAPGENEDRQGVPFIGKVGEKLDSILKYLGTSREDVYITNSVLCRPPNDRNPRGEELEACKWRLDLQIKLLKPRLVILLGKVAMQQMLGKPIKGALSQFFPENLPSGWFNYIVDGHETKVLITYHPSYHLKAPKRAYKATLPHWTKVKNWLENEQA